MNRSAAMVAAFKNLDGIRRRVNEGLRSQFSGEDAEYSPLRIALNRHWALRIKQYTGSCPKELRIHMEKAFPSLFMKYGSAESNAASARRKKRKAYHGPWLDECMCCGEGGTLLCCDYCENVAHDRSECRGPCPGDREKWQCIECCRRFRSWRGHVRLRKKKRRSSQEGDDVSDDVSDDELVSDGPKPASPTAKPAGPRKRQRERIPRTTVPPTTVPTTTVPTTTSASRRC